MNIPINFIEELRYRLPDVNEYNGYSYAQPFVYDGLNFEIKFYKATDNGVLYFWLCNPYNIQVVLINGHHEALN